MLMEQLDEEKVNAFISERNFISIGGYVWLLFGGKASINHVATFSSLRQRLLENNSDTLIRKHGYEVYFSLFTNTATNIHHWTST